MAHGCDARLREYESYVYVTARRWHRSCGEEADDLAQLLWIKIVDVLAKYRASRSNLPEQNFVNGCVQNYLKDLSRNNTRRERREPRPLPMADGEDSGRIFLGGLSIYRERFEERYLVTTADQVYGEVEEGAFTLPATITRDEAQIILMLMRGYTQKDIAEELGVARKRIRRFQDSIESKLQDWAPNSTEPSREPVLVVAA